jgi:hypothetical protein
LIEGLDPEEARELKRNGGEETQGVACTPPGCTGARGERLQLPGVVPQVNLPGPFRAKANTVRLAFCP